MGRALALWFAVIRKNIMPVVAGECFVSAKYNTTAVANNGTGAADSFEGRTHERRTFVIRAMSHEQL